MSAPQVLWEPKEEFKVGTWLARYMRWLSDERGVHVTDYQALWEWSVEELEDFWESIWDYFQVSASEPYEAVLGSAEMPGAEWFPGSRLSYAEHVFRGKDPGAVAIRHASELRELEEMTWAELRSLTERIAGGLRSLGVGPGDR